MEAPAPELSLERRGNGWYLRVHLGEEKVYESTRVADRHYDEERRGVEMEKMLTQSRWPADHSSAAGWQAAWEEVRGEWRNRGWGMERARARSVSWHGKLDHAALKVRGFVRHDGAVPDDDCLWLESSWGKAVRSEGGFTHGGAYPAKAKSLFLISPEDEARRKAEKRRQLVGDLPLKPDEWARLTGIGERLSEVAGHPAGLKLKYELIDMGEPPQPWHGDHRCGQSLAAVLMVSPAHVPPYFLDLTDAWGHGSPKPKALSEKEVTAMTSLEVRKARWDRVRSLGDDDSVFAPTASPAPANRRLGKTRSGGKARGVPLTTMYGDPSRARAGTRETVPRGSATFFDSAPPPKSNRGRGPCPIRATVRPAACGRHEPPPRPRHRRGRGPTVGALRLVGRPDGVGGRRRARLHQGAEARRPGHLLGRVQQEGRVPARVRGPEEGEDEEAEEREGGGRGRGLAAR